MLETESGRGYAAMRLIDVADGVGDEASDDDPDSSEAQSADNGGEPAMGDSAVITDDERPLVMYGEKGKMTTQQSGPVEP